MSGYTYNERNHLVYKLKRMLTFSFKSKVADPADVRPHICMGPDVFFQHARLLTANATLLANVFTPASTPDVHIVFIGLIPERQMKYSNDKSH